MDFTFPPLLAIVVAAVLGGAIGMQRQAAAKPAGFRTHLLVAAAAAAFTAMGAYLHDTRIPSYIVVGIGFLGSGAIIRDGTNARGLTTAASIWMAAAVGLALGYANGFGLSIGVLATIITLVALSLSDESLMMLFHIPRKAELRVECVSPEIITVEVSKLLDAARIHFDVPSLLALVRSESQEVAEIVYFLQVARGRDLNAVIREIGALSGVRRVQAIQPSIS